jgi:uncharacterized protein with ParB-like and HNH nuclease domain
MIIEVQATNFALLSHDEQLGKIAAYAQLLNSLSYTVQILIRNKKIDISSYLNLLEGEAKKTTNEKLALQISLYHDFIAEIVKVNTVLDKKFYMIIPYSSLEKSATQAMKGTNSAALAKSTLTTKTEGVLSQFARIGLVAKILQKEELVKLFYEIFNENIGQAGAGIDTTYGVPMVQPKPSA